MAKRYAKSWLTLDLAAAMPWNDIFAGLAGESVGIVSMLKLVRLLRLGRLLKDLERLKAAAVIRILRLVLGFFLLAHWVACAWWALGVARFNLDDDTGVPWIYRVAGLEAFTFDADAPTAHEFVASYYWALTMLMKSPWVPPDTVAEKAFACVTVVLGAIVFALLLGNVSAR